ncbi:MAG TPA: sugar transferase [Symbiobacteriaceae bacterium]|nr:sugar transferase [Symbiobacteriaceae bacterium]
MRLTPRAWVIAIGDVVLTIGAYLLAFQVWLGGFPAYNWQGFVEVVPLLLVTTLLLLVVYGQYRDLHRPFLEVAVGCVLTAAGVALVVGLGAYLDLDARTLPRGIMLLGGLFQAILLPLWRIGFVRETKRQYFQRPAVLVTAHPSVSPRFPRYIRVMQRCTPGVFLAREACYRGHLVIVDSDVVGRERERLVEWAASLSNDLYLIPTLHDVMTNSGQFTNLGDRPVITIRPLAVPAEYRWLKRVIDVIVSAMLVIIFSPALVVIPLAIYIESGGTVLYRQVREGQHGKQFSLFKFRSMVNGAEDESGPVLAAEGDPRVTRVGRILRASRLDELPQVINVLKGDMSIVGPRPERPEFVEQYAKEYPNFQLREVVKPGLTGLAQVMGRYLTEPDDKLRFDLLYIARYSPWMDLRILMWTVQVVIFPQQWIESPPEWVQELDWKMTASSGSRT